MYWVKPQCFSITVPPGLNRISQMAEILHHNNQFGQLSLLGICVVTEEIRGQFFNLGGLTEDRGGDGFAKIPSVQEK